MPTAWRTNDRRHQQRRAQCLAIGQRHAHASRIARNRRHRHRLDHPNRAPRLHRLIERKPHVPRLQHQAQRFIAVMQFGAIEMQVQQRRPAAQIAVRYHDFFDRLRVGIEIVRQPQRAPHPVRRKRDRERAPIETRRQRLGRFRRIDHHDAHAGLIQRQRQGLPNQPSPAEDHVSIEAVAHAER
jgi:hypothetical protein